MNDAHTKPAKWKRTLIHELIEYWIIFGYLAFFFVAFVWYRRLILQEYQVDYTNYWFPLIQAAVLAKVIMIGDLFRLGRGLEQRSLILPTLFRTAMFGVWVAVFRVLEETIRGLLHGGGVTAGVAEIASKGPDEFLSWCVVIVVAFIPFFAFRELERVLGEEQLRALFWKRGALASGSKLPGMQR